MQIDHGEYFRAQFTDHTTGARPPYQRYGFWKNSAPWWCRASRGDSVGIRQFLDVKYNVQFGNICWVDIVKF